MKTTLLTLTLLFSLITINTTSAQQMPPAMSPEMMNALTCMPYDKFVETANKQMGQYRVGMGITADKMSVLEFYLNPEKRSWIFALIKPNIVNGAMVGKIACMGPFGEMWMQMEPEVKKGQMVYKN